MTVGAIDVRLIAQRFPGTFPNRRARPRPGRVAATALLLARSGPGQASRRYEPGRSSDRRPRSTSGSLDRRRGREHGGWPVGPANLGWPARPFGRRREGRRRTDWTGSAAAEIARRRSRIEARNLGCRLQVRPVCCRDAASGGRFVALERPPREGTRRPASHRIGVLGVADPPDRLRESARGGVLEILPETAWDSLRLETGSTLGNAIGSGLPRATRSPSGT